MSKMSSGTVVKIEPQEVKIKTEIEVKIEPGVATVETSNAEGNEVFIKSEPIWVSTEPEFENNMEQPTNEAKKEVSSPDMTIHDLDMLDKPPIISKKYSATKFIRKKHTEIPTSTYTCDICQKHFPEMQLLIDHKISDSDNCKKQFIDQFQFSPNETAGGKRSEKFLFTGKRIRVPIPAIPRKLPRYSCDLCDEDFGRYSSLLKHKETHNMHACDLCEQTFATSFALAKHSEICSVIKVYVCRFCRREFTQTLTLKEHEKVHFRGDSYYCDICDEEFSQKQELVIHSDIHGTKIHICNVCNKEFNRKSKLLDHKLIHTGPKQYACDKCDKKFTHAMLLTKHSSNHWNYKPFCCDTCGKSFALEKRLARHELIHIEH